MSNGKLKSEMRRAWAVLNEILDEYAKDRADLLAAALAFYTLLSVAPLIIVAVALAGIILGSGAAREEMTRLMIETMGTQGAETINGWVDEVSRTGGIASFVGAVLAAMTSSKLVVQLRSALNQVFGVDEFLAQGFKATVKNYIHRRLFAFAAVLASGPLLIAIVASRAVLSGVHDALFLDSAIIRVALQIMQVSFSIAVVASLTAMVFRAVPDTRMGWRAVWIGAFLTSILFNLGNLLVGLYLGRTAVSATYGAAGSAVVVLLWMYYSAQVFLIGAEFTQVYARRFGRGLKPEEEREAHAAQRAGHEAERAEREASGDAAQRPRRLAGAK